MKPHATYVRPTIYSLTIALGFVIIATLVAFHILPDRVVTRYAVVIDAGSSGSRFHLFRWTDALSSKELNLKYVASVKIEPGISSYLDRIPTAVHKLEQGITDVLKIEKNLMYRGNIPLFLGATAGMRLEMIPKPVASSEMIEELQIALPQLTGLQAKYPKSQIGMLSGTEEGITGWTSVNNLRGLITGKEQKEYGDTVGSLDLGGASFQIAFAISRDRMKPNDPVIYYRDVTVFGKPYYLFSASFLCYGKDQFRNRLVASLINKAINAQNNMGKSQIIVRNPCLMKGYFRNLTKIDLDTIFDSPCVSGLVDSPLLPRITRPDDSKSYFLTGSGSGTMCKIEVKEVLQPTELLKDIQPPEPEGTFQAYAGFGYTMKNIFGDIQESITRKMWQKKLYEKCEIEWHNATNNVDRKYIRYIKNTCFDGAYVESILEMLGFQSDEQWKKIDFAIEINGKPISWASGLLMTKFKQIPNLATNLAVPISTDAFAILFASFFIVYGIWGLCHFNSRRYFYESQLEKAYSAEPSKIILPAD